MALGAQAQIYVGVSESGGVLLSNHASDAAPEVLVAAEPEASPGRPAVAVAGPPTPSAFPARAMPATPAALGPRIREAARQHAVPERLLTAVVAVESGFDPRAVSPKGAKGLMQLMPDTARRFGVKDVFAVQDNLGAGARYLRELMQMFPNDLSLALAAYNAGEGAVLRAGRRVPEFRETQDYVAKVLSYAGTPLAIPSLPAASMRVTPSTPRSEGARWSD